MSNQHRSAIFTPQVLRYALRLELMKAIVGVFIAIVAIACHAQQPHERVRFSAGDPALRLVESDETGAKGYLAVWKGRSVLTGKLVIEFDRAPHQQEQTDTVGASFFEPDAASQAKLPAAVGFYPLPVKVLWLSGKPRALLEPLIGRRGFSQVANGKLARYEYPAEIVIKEFSTGVDCDHRSYSVEVVQVRLLRPERVALAQHKNLGC